MRISIIASAFAALFVLSACGETTEQHAATGALGGAVVGGLPGAAVGGVGGAAIGDEIN